MKKILLLAVCWFVGGCITTYQDTAEGLRVSDNLRKFYVEGKGGKYFSTEKEIELITSLPNNIGGLVADGGIMDYEQQTNGLGYSRKYNDGIGGALWADVYAYNMRLENLTDGIASAEFDKIFNHTLNEIKSLDGKLYKDISVFAETEEANNFNGKSMIFKHAKFSAIKLPENKKVVSNLYLTIYNGIILKVRASAYVGDAHNLEVSTADADKYFTAFVQSLVENILADKENNNKILQ